MLDLSPLHPEACAVTDARFGRERAEGKQKSSTARAGTAAQDKCLKSCYPRQCWCGGHGTGNSITAQAASLEQSLTAGRPSALLFSIVWSWATSFASPVFCLTRCFESLCCCCFLAANLRIGWEVPRFPALTWLRIYKHYCPCFSFAGIVPIVYHDRSGGEGIFIHCLVRK